MLFCKNLEGKVLPTQGGRAKFTLSSVKVDSRNRTMSYIPKSTGRERYVAMKNLEKVLARHSLTGSLRPIDYVGITVNAPYTLRLMELFLKNQQKFHNSETMIAGSK